MKKTAIIFTIIFVCGILGAPAQTSATTEKQGTKTETVKKAGCSQAKCCCANNEKSAKADSRKCCTKDKAGKSCSESSSKAEATTEEKKADAVAAEPTK